MPASKLTFKENHLKFEVEGLECTLGTEVVKVDKLSVELDVNDLLRAKLPEITSGYPESITLVSFGVKKIQCIKAVRGFTGLGLKEAKALVESAPNAEISAALKTKEQCTDFCKGVESCGGRADMVYSNTTVPSVMDKLREMLTEALGKEIK